MFDSIGEIIKYFAICYFFTAVGYAILFSLFKLIKILFKSIKILLRRPFYCVRHLCPYFTLEELDWFLNYNNKQDYKLVYSKNDFHIVKTVKIDKEWWEPKYRLFYITKECIKG